MLKLKAKDAEDLQVISAVLQDSIAPVCDMVWQQPEKTFIMVVQRLIRDKGELERICTAFHLRGIEGVQTHGIDLKDQGRMLDLLAIMMDPEHPNHITMIFAGDAKIRIKLGDWSLIIEDFGEPWPAHCNPCHDGENAA